MKAATFPPSPGSSECRQSGGSNSSSLSVDGSGNVYISESLSGSGSDVKVTRLAYIGPKTVNEPATAGSDSLQPVIPSGVPLTAQSDQPWLTIDSTTNDVVKFSFAANLIASPRTAHITVNGGSISVTQAPGTFLAQTIAFGPIPNQNLSAQPLTIFASTSSGLPISFTSNSPAVCSVTGSQVTLIATGLCSITASQPGNANYAPALPVTQTFMVVSAQAPQPFITGSTPRFARNDFTGFVGMEFQTGTQSVAVTSLGRIFVLGNGGTHLVKLVNGDGTDVPGGSVAITMSSATPLNTFQYAPLPATIFLKPRTPYFLMSQEVRGGDLWYEYALVTTTNVAAVQGPAYFSSQYILVPVPRFTTHAYIGPNMLTAPVPSTPPPTVAITAPLDNSVVLGNNVTLSATASAGTGLKIISVAFQVDNMPLIGGPVKTSPYQTALDTTTLTNGLHTITAVATDDNGGTATSAPIHVTVGNIQSPPTGTALITGVAGTRLRNDFSGYVGMKFTVGAAPITVRALGRIFVPGNSFGHQVKLVNAATGLDVPGGTTNVSLFGDTPFAFRYGALPAPIVLPAFTSYYLVSSEQAGQDQWYDYSPVTNTAAASVDQPVYSVLSNYVRLAAPNYSYVPVNLLYGP